MTDDELGANLAALTAQELASRLLLVSNDPQFYSPRYTVLLLREAAARLREGGGSSDK